MEISLESQQSDRSERDINLKHASLMIEELSDGTATALPDNLPATSLRIYCPHCRSHGNTKITLQNGTLAWLSCSTLLLSGCMFGCCLVPFLFPYLKDIVHECSMCGKKIGIYHRM